MTAYLPIVLGQDALQWLRHLPQHCIDDWSDFSWCFIANFESLSDKPTQPWDLKSIRRRGDETLRSYLKRFQTMRNRIPKVAEAAVIEDFYRGSNDSAFVRAILQKVSTTSEQLFREADLYITADERAQDLIGGMKPTPPAPRRDVNTRQVLGEGASRRSPRRRTTRLSCPRGTPRRRTNIGRHPRRPMSVPQGHAPHPSKLQRLQALRRERPTLPTSATSLTTRRTRRTSTTLAAGRGRRRSIPARRWRSQHHLWRTRFAREQEAAEAQRPLDTGGGHQTSHPVLMVRTPDHLHLGRSVAQLRSSGQIPAPR
jgi:hypothetical protein